jgi:hypothetical protein
MFYLLDGREHFYQWDKDRKIVLSDTTVTEVHYCNKTGDCSLVCAVYEMDGLHVADVPNVLLTTAWDIRVYAYCADYTKVEKRFKVAARSKPDDYIYTETEIYTVDKAAEKAAEKAVVVAVDNAMPQIVDAVISALPNGDEVSY